MDSPLSRFETSGSSPMTEQISSHDTGPALVIAAECVGLAETQSIGSDLRPERLAAAAIATRHESIDDQGVLALLRSVGRLGCTASGSDAKKATSLPRLRSIVVERGFPIIFLMMNPGERSSVLSL